MLAQLSLWLVAATLGQAPTDATWLKAIPGDIDVVVRSRGLEPTYRDVSGFIKALSPQAGQVAAPALSNLLTQFQNEHGALAVKSPWVGLGRIVPPGPDGMVPFAVLVLQDDYKAVLKNLARGQDVALKPEAGGIDSFDNPHGNGSWYAVKGAGFVAFGPDKTLIAALARPGGKTLDTVLTPALTQPFLEGDLGLYVNAAELSMRYAGQIDQAKQMLMGALDQAAQQSPNGASMETVKMLYGGLFDSIKEASRLTLNLDFAAAGFRLAGQLELKPGADPTKPVVTGQPGKPVLGNLPADAMVFMYMNMEAKTVAKWQNMSLRMLSPEGKTSPELNRATALFHGLGRMEMVGSSAFEDGIRTFNVVKTKDPKAYLAATEAMLLAMKGGDSPFNVYKDVKIEADVQTYQGLSFSHVKATIDGEKLAKLGGANNPGGGADTVKAMFGADGLSYWIGTDGTKLIQVTAPTWEAAKAQLDRYAKADSGIGTAPTFQYVKSALADQADLMTIVNTQGFVRMLASQLSLTLNRPELKELGELPKEPALFGLSLTSRPPAGYEFRFVLPSEVGPVVERGLIPVFQAMQQGPAKP